MGVSTLAFLKRFGKEPGDKERIMMERISGPTIWNTQFRNVVGMVFNWWVSERRQWVVFSKSGRKMSSK